MVLPPRAFVPAGLPTSVYWLDMCLHLYTEIFYQYKWRASGFLCCLRDMILLLFTRSFIHPRKYLEFRSPSFIHIALDFCLVNDSSALLRDIRSCRAWASWFLSITFKGDEISIFWMVERWSRASSSLTEMSLYCCLLWIFRECFSILSFWLMMYWGEPSTEELQACDTNSTKPGESIQKLKNLNGGLRMWRAIPVVTQMGEWSDSLGSRKYASASDSLDIHSIFTRAWSSFL